MPVVFLPPAVARPWHPVHAAFRSQTCSTVLKKLLLRRQIASPTRNADMLIGDNGLWHVLWRYESAHKACCVEELKCMCLETPNFIIMYQVTGGGTCYRASKTHSVEHRKHNHLCRRHIISTISAGPPWHDVGTIHFNETTDSQPRITLLVMTALRKTHLLVI